MNRELREQVDRAVHAGDMEAAARSLAALWRDAPDAATAGHVARRLQELRGKLPLTAARVTILRSFTVEPMMPLLAASAFGFGIDLDADLGDFNAYAQEILTPDSRLYAFDPSIVILAVQTRDIAPELWPDAGEFDSASAGAVVERVVGQLRGLVEAFRRNSDATLIVHNLEAPEVPAAGILDAQSAYGQAASVARINAGIREIAAAQRGVYVLDYDALVARHGRRNWHDEKKWLTVRLPIRANYLGELTAEWLRYIVPLCGKIAKVLAVDLDNTLWGGVIGEDGMAGIQLGGEYPGAAYRAVQRALLEIAQRGILLAVASKNNPADAMEAMEQHPGMLVRAKHFAALRINWEDKSENLRALAKELNLGLDAIAFLDDNPVERQRVREAAPEVMVIEPGSDPMEFARAVREFPAFQRLTVSEEDKQRGEMYAAERQRSQLESASGSREDFFRSLKQEAHVAPVTPVTLARVAQLTQKTNQFNLTTQRYTEQQIESMSAQDGWEVLSIRVSDRYCDNGLVGVAITHDRGVVCEIDTFLLSCRVIGRTVETALLAQIAEKARARGCRRLEGWFRPTKKNAPAREFYSSHGFSVAEEREGNTLWRFDLTAGTIETPEWIKVLWADRMPSAADAQAGRL